MNFYKLSSGLAAICCIVALVMVFNGDTQQAGPFFIAFFITLAIAFRGYPMLKGFAYTVIIFAAVTTALFYPQYFKEVDGFLFTTLITPLIQLIMFGMGTSMSFKDFVGIARMPRGVFIGVNSNFINMTLLGFTMERLSNFQKEIEEGIILIG